MTFNCSYSHNRYSEIDLIANGGGCSCEECCCATKEAEGTVEQSCSFLENAFGGVLLSYYHRFTYDGQFFDPSFGFGYNWLFWSAAYITQTADCSLAVIWSTEQAVWFDQEGPSSFTPLYGARHTMTLDGSNYRVTAPDGTVSLFSQVTGKLLQTITPGGQVLENVYAEGKLDETRRSITVSGTTYVNSWKYIYGSAAEASLIKSVTLRQWKTGGSWLEIRRILVDYYGTGSTIGSQGDLKQITLQTLDTTWKDLTKQCFRYYTSTSGVGIQHGLKFVIGPEAYRRMEANGLDPLDPNDDPTAYADAYYEYYLSDRRVKTSITAAGSRTFTMTYDVANNPISYNDWQLRAEVIRPDDSKRIVFSNHVGQDLLTDLWQDKNSSTGPRWVEYTYYNSDAKPTEQYSPAAITMTGVDAPYKAETGITPSLIVKKEPSSGLVRLTDYFPSGDGATYPQYQKVRRGTGGTVGNLGLFKVREFTYTKRTINGGTPTQASLVLPATSIEYRDEASGGSNASTTTFTYNEFHAGTNQIKIRTVGLPVVSTSENGTNTNDTIVEVIDIQGRVTSRTDPRGIPTTYSYHEMTGARKQMVEASGSLNVTTDYEADALGRTTRALGPAHDIHEADATGSTYTLRANARTASWTLYRDDKHEVRSGRGYIYVASSVTHTVLVNPISITQMDHADRTVEAIVAKQADVDEAVNGDAILEANWCRWTRDLYDNAGLLTESWAYHLIPTGPNDPEDPPTYGTVGTNYDKTSYGYDQLGRQNKLVSPGGTITKSSLDGKGRPTLVRIGLSESAGNLVIKPVTTNEYDRNGNLTKSIAHLADSSTDSSNRVTIYGYDFRNRQEVVDGEEKFYLKRFFNNLNRTIQEDQHDTNSGGTILARNETKYDARGRAYESWRYDAATIGTTNRKLVDKQWHDKAGNVIKSQPSGAESFTKMVYDNLGRVTARYSGYFDGTPPPPDDPSALTNNIIFTQTVTSFDAASNVLQATRKDRYHNSTGAGSIDRPDPAYQPAGRCTFLAYYHDGINRPLVINDFGTNQDSATGSFTRDPSPTTTSSTTVLVTKTLYNACGEAEKQIDTASVITTTTRDDAGRVKEVVENSGGATAPADVTTQTTYTPDGNVATLTAINSDTTNQVTTYVYGTDLTNNDIARSDLLIEEQYPDKVTNDDNDKVSYLYNRQSQVKQMTDQNGTVHVYDYDKLGRQTDDRVTTLGTLGSVTVDGTVRRIRAMFDARGLVEKLTSFDDPTAESDGDIVNEVRRAYNGLWQLITEYQQTDGTVDTDTTPKVVYAYETSVSVNNARITTMTYPTAARVLSYQYGSSGSAADKLSRIASMNFAGTTGVVSYEYFGLGGFSKVLYGEPVVSFTLEAAGSPSIPLAGSLDFFSRLKQMKWQDGSSNVLEHLEYGYDVASNRTYRLNVISHGMSPAKPFDELYAYDGIHRLKDFKRGVLNSSNNAMETGTTTRHQIWDLDPTGNWKGFDELVAPTLDQSRTSNKANEIISITNAANPQWITPTYDRNGNMKRMPRPAQPDDGYLATYDAWNRLAALTTNDTEDPILVNKYQYDGLNRRTIKDTYDEEGDPEETRHFLYSRHWQILEERIGDELDEADVEREYVWGLRYLDDCVLRDRTDDEPLDERLYAIQDANWNVATVTNENGAVQQRLLYTPYGERTLLQATFSMWSGDDTVMWEVQLSGYMRDLDTDLYSIRHRVLHSSLGRWLTRDPVGYVVGDMNLYCFVGDRPVNNVDPMGLRTWAEVRWCWANPVCCYAAKDSGKEVTRVTTKRFPLWDDNTVENAVHHCTWMCYVAGMICCTRKDALALGRAHEDYDRNPPHDKKMDYRNNRVGASLSEKGISVEECSDKCIAAAKAYELYWFAPVEDEEGPREGLPKDYPGYDVNDSGTPGDGVGKGSSEPPGDGKGGRGGDTFRGNSGYGSSVGGGSPSAPGSG